jgi:hypothetical protein
MKNLSAKKEKENLAILEKLAKGLGIKVSSGKLLYAGLRLKGGQCILRDEPWLILDRNQPYEEQLDLYREAFNKLNMDLTDLPPTLKDILYPGILSADTQEQETNPKKTSKKPE